MAADCHTKQIGLMKYIHISIIVLSVALSACASTVTTTIQENEVVHIVLIWLKEPGNQEHVQQVIEVSNQLKEIPGIQEIRVGRSIPSDRKIVDDSFDIGLCMVFGNQEDMETYLVHPEHKKAVTTILKQLASKVLVYDISVPAN